MHVCDDVKATKLKEKNTCLPFYGDLHKTKSNPYCCSQGGHPKPSDV